LFRFILKEGGNFMSVEKENYFIYADPEKCLGCKSCEIACGLAHSKTDLITAVLEGYRIRPRNRVVQAEGIRVPLQCRQCDDAPCAQVCPSGAIRIRTEAKETGDGRIKKAKALKCDLCIEKNGEINQEECACIRACPTKAITLVDYEELVKRTMEARAREIAVVASGRDKKE
jgi:carbon-monoxide dehydrogenase iron sulfur subunit